MTWPHSTLLRMEASIPVRSAGKWAETLLMLKDTWKVNTFRLIEDMSVKFVTVTSIHGRPFLVTTLHITEINKIFPKVGSILRLQAWVVLMTWPHSTLLRMEASIPVRSAGKWAETLLTLKDTWKVNTFRLMEDMSVKFVTVILKPGMPFLVIILNITESKWINVCLS